MVGLLAEAFLARSPGEVIVHDPRVVWNVRTPSPPPAARAHQARTGHAFLKQALRDTGAVYGGEMSAHHYFRDFVYCDSGMIPLLLIAELISRRGRTLGEMVATRVTGFPSSGEINFHAADPAAAIARVRSALGPDAIDADETDGLGLNFTDWRFNLRASNTEPLLRLNVEARGDPVLVERAVDRLRSLIAP